MRELTFDEMSFVSGGSGPSGPGNVASGGIGTATNTGTPTCPDGQTQTGSSVAPNGAVTITCENSWDEALEDDALLITIFAFFYMLS